MLGWEGKRRKKREKLAEDRDPVVIGRSLRVERAEERRTGTEGGEKDAEWGGPVCKGKIEARANEFIEYARTTKKK